jgi:hypothetical protein
MLESSSLLILPWHDDPSRGGWIRLIADGATTTALGLVCARAPAAASWLSWLRGQRLEVLEGDDAALLMMLIRPWGLSRAWQVQDAEERAVGTVHPLQLVDSEGGRRGIVDRQDSKHGRILGAESQALAHYEVKPDHAAVLRFAADLEPNPFLRMLLLAGVVLQEPRPSGKTR